MKKIILTFLVIGLGYALQAQTMIDCINWDFAKRLEDMLNTGANPNQLDADSLTPLIVASGEGKPEMVRILLDHKATVDTPRMRKRWTALMNACGWAGNLEVCRLLIENGADVNAESTTGETPLMLAARDGYKDVVKLLLAHGADPKKRNNKGQNALYYATNRDVQPVRHMTGDMADAFDRDREEVAEILKALGN